MKFLIVDAEAGRQRRLRSILAMLGHKAADMEILDDPKLVVNHLRKKRFECAIIALDLPKTDGLSLLKEIRETSTLKNLPVILFGGSLSRDIVLSGAQAGANGFLGDPCSASDVEQVLSRLAPRA